MNADLIKKKLADLNNSGKKSSFTEKDSQFWKPDPGVNLIRILPNFYNRDYPFTELLFYYDFGKTILSPKSFGDPDPIFDFSQRLRRSKDDMERKMGYKLSPVTRTYVTILVRGKEHEGPKIWGFGKTVYAELLGIMADPDYGDITDLTSGRDVVVTYTEPVEGDKYSAKTKIHVKPNITKAFDDPAVLEKVKGMKNINEVWEKPTVEQLDAVLKEYLSGEKPADVSPSKGKTTPSVPSRQEPDDFNMDVSKVPVPSGPAESNSKLTKDVMNQIDDMFNDI